MLLTILALTLLQARADRFSDPTADQKVDQIVSIFENSTPELQYSYIEALNDGRGYTAGRAGFTTATGDLVEVVHHFADLKPLTSDWLTILPRLEELKDDESGSLKGLQALPDLWRKTSDDPVFRKAQDDVTEDMYKAPAREVCRKLNITTALGFLVIYDTIIQHGDGGDEDSLSALIKRTHPASDEKSFVKAFLDVRRADLMNPANSDTTDEWRDSVDRVDALKRLVDADAWELRSPLRVNVWGDDYAL